MGNKTKYLARITATLKYNNKHGIKSKETDTLLIEICTRELDKKPTQSVFKSFLRLAVEKGLTYSLYLNDFDFKYVKGLELLSYSPLNENYKLSNISFISIEAIE